MRFIIIDDDKYMSELISTILRKNGSQTTTHTNIGEGLRHMMNEDFDIAIFDIHLPGMDGLSAIPMAKEINPNICVGVMTGDLNPETREKALNQGADFFLQKPDDILNVWSILSSYTKEKK